MIQPEAIRCLNARQHPVQGRYVLYWMQAAQRSHWNAALEFAILQANTLARPVLVLFCLVDDFPGANLRHYVFMLQGLRETRLALRKRGIQMVLMQGPPGPIVAEVAENAALVVVDAGLLRIQRAWRTEVGGRLSCPLFEVEANLIVPAWTASDKAEFSAATFRPRIKKRLGSWLRPLRQARCRKDSLGLAMPGLALDDVEQALTRLHIDKTVEPVAGIVGGTSAAKARLKGFLSHTLDRFAEFRNDPAVDCTSHLSPYLHFGQISPLYVALQAARTESPGRDAFLEELIVRRELSSNFIYYNALYDRYEGLASWARGTLDDNARQRRPYVYSLAQFDQAATHDPYWNAAQLEMVLTGKMHGYMRMYWGKKILEWSETPQQAFQTALYLNDKYEVDGRDPNGYAGVAWCFGQHDRPWPRHPVFGQVRCMNAAGLARKFDPDAYVERIRRLPGCQLM
jgi:deoxyribodipyrimidine photo-lyase